MPDGGKVDVCLRRPIVSVGECGIVLRQDPNSSSSAFLRRLDIRSKLQGIPMSSAPQIQRVFTTGNVMSARAAIDSGCRFFAGYPITPASEIFRQMTLALPGHGGVALAAPDEISALAYCVGASMRGVPSMTATSGPGWCLMVETIGYAVMTEIPVVIALVQRLGPSTGAATQGAQGDIELVSGAVSGGYRFPVFAPSTAAECYSETQRAFAWAERLRTPVVVLSDKEVASTREVVDLSALSQLEPAQRSAFQGPGPYLSYALGEHDSDVPPFVPVGGDWPVTMTGSAHNQQGQLKKNDPDTLRNLRHLHTKIEAAEPDLGAVDLDLQPGAKTLLISFGVSARACRDAVQTVRESGGSVSLAVVRTLFPLPRTMLPQALAGIERVVVVEENYDGQYRRALGPLLGDCEVVGVNGLGRLIEPEEVCRAVLL